AIASRIDCFSDIPTSIFGDRLKQQVLDRLKFYDSGELPPKNVDVMQLALQEADVEREDILAKEKKRKKKEKKRRKEAEAAEASLNCSFGNGTSALTEAVNNMEVA
ncbi:unnamed protein product, partial [Rotaria magnacalcarata]